MAKARKVAGGRGGRPQMRTVRKGGWTEAKKTAFFVELAATCNVSAALAKVGMGAPQVYNLRQSDAAFRARWNAALSEGYARLELMLLERAMIGTVRTVRKADGRTETMTEYPNAIALQLLRMHRDTVARHEAEPEPGAVEELRDKIARKLTALAKRVEAEEAAKAARGKQGG